MLLILMMVMMTMTTNDVRCCRSRRNMVVVEVVTMMLMVSLVVGYVTDFGPAVAASRHAMPQSTTLGLHPVIHVPNYMDHYSFTEP